MLKKRYKLIKSKEPSEAEIEEKGLSAFDPEFEEDFFTLEQLKLKAEEIEFDIYYDDSIVIIDLEADPEDSLITLEHPNAKAARKRAEELRIESERKRIQLATAQFLFDNWDKFSKRAFPPPPYNPYEEDIPKELRTTSDDYYNIFNNIFEGAMEALGIDLSERYRVSWIITNYNYAEYNDGTSLYETRWKDYADKEQAIRSCVDSDCDPDITQIHDRISGEKVNWLKERDRILKENYEKFEEEERKERLKESLERFKKNSQESRKKWMAEHGYTEAKNGIWKHNWIGDELEGKYNLPPNMSKEDKYWVIEMLETGGFDKIRQEVELEMLEEIRKANWIGDELETLANFPSNMCQLDKLYIIIEHLNNVPEELIELTKRKIKDLEENED